MRRTSQFAAAVVLAGALVLSACTGPTSTQNTPEGGGGGTANIYLYQEPAGVFGPLAPASGPDNQVNSLIFQGLLQANPKFELKPVLAESYEVSPDAKTFTFKLRKGLKWSDGETLDSEDVMYTYNTLANPKTGSATAGSFTSVTGAKEVAEGKADTVSGFSAPDANTFVIKAAEPNFGLLALVGQSHILPEHVLGDVPVAQLLEHEFFKKPTVGSGPFMFDEYKVAQHVHVVANPHANPAPKLSDVYLKPMTSDVATAQLGNGGLDVATVSPLDLDTISGFDNVQVQEALSAGFIRVALNQSKEQFSDKRVRQAFLHAVNRQQLVDQVLNGKAEVQNSDFYQPRAPKDLKQYEFDPAKAKQLLTEAGWDFDQEITMIWVPGQRDRDASATVVQSQLAEVGVKVKLKQVQGGEISKFYDEKSYDMVLYGGGNYASDPWNVNVIAGCETHYPNGGNINFFCNKELDKVMKEANATTDPTKRAELYGAAARISNEQVDLFWLYSPYGLWAVNDRLKNFQAPGSQEVAFWDPASWSIG